MSVTAGRQPDHEPFECDECGGPIVIDGEDEDKFCASCGLLTTVDTIEPDEVESDWEKWRDHRRDEYSGWYGEDRIRFVGGFKGPWIYADEDEQYWNGN